MFWLGLACGLMLGVTLGVVLFAFFRATQEGRDD